MSKSNLYCNNISSLSVSFLNKNKNMYCSGSYQTLLYSVFKFKGPYHSFLYMDLFKKVKEQKLLPVNRYFF